MKEIALITGASSGIGAEFAKIHASKGGDLILVARRLDKLEALRVELIKQYSIDVVLIEKDLSVPGAGTEVFTEVLDKGLSITYLFNNAGFGGIGNFHERNWSEDLAMINLNIVALTELTRLFLPQMIANKKGYILNVSSTASLMPGPLQAVYYATKAFVTSFSNAIHEELRSTGVSVTALLPGATKTEFGEVSGMDKTVLFDKTASARSVALDGYEGMLKGKLNVVSGLTFAQKIMMSFMPFMPKKMVLAQIKKMQEVRK